MRDAIRRPSILLILLLSAGAALFLACGGGGGSPTSPPPMGGNGGTVSFRLAGPGIDETVTHEDGANLVFCRRNAGFADLWIRSAESSAANGESSPHLDIDVCNLGNGGTFTPMDPQSASCGNGQTFDIFWHGSTTTYVNTAAAPACTLTINKNGMALSGTFSCSGLAEFNGTGTIDVLDGTFDCTEA